MWDGMTFIARKDGQFGILYESEFSSIESENGESGHSKEFMKSLEPHANVVSALIAGLRRLEERFPGVYFAVPAAEEVINGRPAAWAFAPDGLLNVEERTTLGFALLNL